MVFKRITPRQGEFLRLYAEKKNLRQVAETMGVSFGTANTMSQLIMVRLKVDSMDEACRMARAEHHLAHVALWLRNFRQRSEW